MIKLFITVAFCSLLLNSFTASATTYFVRVDGSDSNTGLVDSKAEAWNSLNYAINNLTGGDTLFIGDGEHLVHSILLQHIHGSENKPTLIKSQNNWGAKISLHGNPEYGNVINIISCSHLIIDGIEVYTQSPNTGTGIEASTNSHHITIRNCYVHDCGCGGISGRGSDYINIEHNVVRANAKRSKWNCSGISLLLARNFDDEPGYHMIIRGNVAFENECRLPFEHGGYKVPTDGNGIILDLFNNAINDYEGEVGGYRSKTLIENNLSFNNGGRGINIFRSDNVTIRNNTSWHNVFVLSENSTGHGEIESYEAKNMAIYNNILVKNPHLNTRAIHLHEYDSKGNTVKNNLIIGKTHYWPKNIGEKDNSLKDSSFQDYVRFLNPTKDVEFESIADFRKYFGLMNDSPAIGSASDKNFPSTDLEGVSRPNGNGGELGCFEFNK